jgi:hypothetical protein
MLRRRVFPLTVTLPADDALGEVEVEPVLPGCDCFPAKEAVTIPAASEPTTVRFWVVPGVYGRVDGARVVIRRKGRVLTELPLNVRVGSRTWAWVCAAAGLLVPYALIGLRSWKPIPDGGDWLYLPACSWVLANLRPDWAGLGLLTAAAVLFVWSWPRRREAAWGVG